PLFPKSCRRQVLPADGTLALGSRPWVRNHIRQRRSRQFLAEWIQVEPLKVPKKPCEPPVKGNGGVAASHRLADLLRSSGVGGRNLRRCCPVLRYGLLGQRLERTGPDRRLGPPSARLLRETRAAQTPLLPSAVQKRPPQSPGRTSQASVGGGRTKGLAT